MDLINTSLNYKMELMTNYQALNEKLGQTFEPNDFTEFEIKLFNNQLGMDISEYITTDPDELNSICKYHWAHSSYKSQLETSEKLAQYDTARGKFSMGLAMWALNDNQYNETILRCYLESALDGDIYSVNNLAHYYDSNELFFQVIACTGLYYNKKRNYHTLLSLMSNINKSQDEPLQKILHSLAVVSIIEHSGKTCRNIYNIIMRITENFFEIFLQNRISKSKQEMHEFAHEYFTMKSELFFDGLEEHTGKILNSLDNVQELESIIKTIGESTEKTMGANPDPILRLYHGYISAFVSSGLKNNPQKIEMS